MIALAVVLLLAQQPLPPCPKGNPDCKPWERAWNADPFADLVPKERLGVGPHTLVISDGNAMTRMNYSTGPACQRARDRVRLQTDSRLTNTNPKIIYGAPRVQAFCVPR